MTLRIDRSLLSETAAYRLDNALDNAAHRRERNVEAKRCINDTKNGTHGPATHGCRCCRCYLVHLVGAAAVRERGVHALAREHGIDLNPTAQQGA